MTLGCLWLYLKFISGLQPLIRAIETRPLSICLFPQLRPYAFPVTEGLRFPMQQAGVYLIMCLICSKMLFSSVVFRASIRYWLNSSKNISFPSSYRP